jgi:hypothetical protein
MMGGMRFRPRFSLRALMIAVALIAVFTWWAKGQWQWAVAREEALTRVQQQHIIIEYDRKNRLPWYSQLLGCKRSVLLFASFSKDDPNPERRKLAEDLTRLFPEAILLPNEPFPAGVISN